MIRRMRQKFMLVSMGSFCLVVLLLIGTINIFNYSQCETQSAYLLSLLEENGGSYPDYAYKDKDKRDGGDWDLTEETKYQTRYFYICVSDDGTITDINLDSIAAVSDTTAKTYAKEVIDSGKTSGYKDYYKFKVVDQDSGQMIIFLDCNLMRVREMKVFTISIYIALASLVLVFMVLYFFSKKAVAPFVEIMHKQKQFITDAGHEIKTPLAIISANAEVLEMSYGENEWTTSIRNQTTRLNELVQGLLTLSRLEEMPDKIALAEIDMSSVTRSEAEPFRTLATNKGKNLEINIQDNLKLKCDEKQIRQIVSVLLDNAVKYADDGGCVTLELTGRGNNIVLKISNPYEGASEPELQKAFERFRRTDASRARETGGYGIGLSIARAIMEFNHGKISVTVPQKDQVCFMAVFTKKM